MGQVAENVVWVVKSKAHPKRLSREPKHSFRNI
jgi:hypothetical protein